MQLIKSTIGLLLSATLTISTSSQAESFSEFMQSQQYDTSAQFNQYKSEHEAEFEAYKKELQDAFNSYKASVAKVWGKKNAAVPDQKTDVSYQDNMKQRSIVDYEKGKVTVDVILSPNEAKDKNLVQKKIQQALSTTINRGSDPRSIIDIAKNPSQTRSKGTPVLQNLVQSTDGKPLTNANTRDFIHNQSKKTTARNTTGTDNKPRVIVSTSFAMIPDHIRVRAQKYVAPVKKYSGQMKLPTELVFAIMETESFFNPDARSAVPAFGLMQLVPTSGARDAYRLLFNKDRVVTDRYLYNPDNNIKLGTAFIHKLYYIYFDGIKDPEARTWAAIAGYNTGAGNVFATFAGKYRRSKFGNRSNWKKQALSSINSKTPEQVFNYLKRNLPHRETRNYIQNIRKRTDKYRSL